MSSSVVERKLNRLIGDPTGGRRARPPPPAKYPAEVLGKCFGALFKDPILRSTGSPVKKTLILRLYDQ